MYGDLQLAFLYVVWAYLFRVAEAWGDEEKGTDWTTWGLDCVPGLRRADVLCSMICARPALQHLPTSPLLRGSLQVQPNRAKARPQLHPRIFTHDNFWGTLVWLILDGCMAAGYKTGGQGLHRLSACLVNNCMKYTTTDTTTFDFYLFI